MKNILLLTDFSENSKAASETALALSQKLHTNLLLLNAFTFYPTAENYVGSQWYPEMFRETEEASQERLYALKGKLEELSPKTLGPGDRQPIIHTDVEAFGLKSGVIDILEKNHIELIVMGSHDEGAFKANHANSVIGTVKTPVLVVPAGTNLKQATEVIYATDYDLEDIDAISFLVKIAKAFDLAIKVVHVTGSKSNNRETDKAAFEAYLEKFHSARVTYDVINGKDLASRLLRLTKTEHASLLAMLHHQHSFLGGIFSHSDSKDLLKYKKIPVLIFPANE